MKIRNTWTGETQEVFNVSQINGEIVYKIASRPGATPGPQFFEGHPQFSPTGRRTADGYMVLFLDSSWEVVSKSGKPESKPQPKPGKPGEFDFNRQEGEGDPEPDPDTTPDPDSQDIKILSEAMKRAEAEKAAESKKQEQPQPQAQAPAQAADIANAFLMSMAQAIAQHVKGEVSAEFGPMIDKAMKAAQQQAPAQVVEFKTPWSAKKMEGVTIANFKRICVTVMQDIPVYMYGPAGSGKSYAARQVAEALGLDYYESSEVLFAHEMKGYGDAGGKYVETPFYNAFTKGGLFFLDEVDASAPEALVVLNNAIANKSFDFPVVGNKRAHENFRVIAAGNTTLTGADLQYTARQVQDTSFKNRFFFEKVDYSEAIELQAANGDKEIVNFIHDLRQAAAATRIVLTVSPRQCKQLANPYLNEVYSPADLVQCSVMQEKGKDEINILYNAMKDKSNKWAKAMKELC